MKISCSPQPIQIGWRDVSMILTHVLRLCGHWSGQPSGVDAQSNVRIRSPISPPPAKSELFRSASNSADGPVASTFPEADFMQRLEVDNTRIPQNSDQRAKPLEKAMNVRSNDRVDAGDRGDAETPGRFGDAPRGFRLPSATRVGPVRLDIADLE